MAWLSGWNKRIKFTVDYTKIDAALSYFPVTVFLTPTHGDCIFDELTADANRLKIAFTKADGTTELYGEIEKWDDGNESAIIHISRDGWEIASDADTDFYMYFDVDHADNTTYIGDIDSTPAQSVWDSSYEAVYHMNDGASTSAIYDSTSNNNDGTKKGAGEPAEATGQVGQAQDFDGSDDYIEITGVTDAGTTHTIEAVIYSHDSTSAGKYFLDIQTGRLLFGWGSDNAGKIGVYDGTWRDFGDSPSVNEWHHVAFVLNGSNSKMLMYLDGALYGSELTYTPHAIGGDIAIGARHTFITYNFDGIIDETHISSSLRTAAWLKATYYSLFDGLLTYGSEEEAPSGANSLFFGFNF